MTSHTYKRSSRWEPTCFSPTSKLHHSSVTTAKWTSTCTERQRLLFCHRFRIKNRLYIFQGRPTGARKVYSGSLPVLDELQSCTTATIKVVILTEARKKRRRDGSQVFNLTAIDSQSRLAYVYWNDVPDIREVNCGSVPIVHECQSCSTGKGR